MEDRRRTGQQQHAPDDRSSRAAVALSPKAPRTTAPETNRLWVQLFGTSVAVSLVFGVLAVLVALLADLPLRDPDGLLGPSYVRLPLIVLGMMALDVLPRLVARRPPIAELLPALAQVVRDRWPARRLTAVAVGLGTFYIAYVSYRNLKSFLPFMRDHLSDPALVESDRWFAFGNHPGDVLHELLGTGVSAEVLSFVYMGFLPFVPFTLAAALVWSSDLVRGAWYVNALSLNWIIGTVSYYMLPSLGPIYVEGFRFADLPATEVSGLQIALWDNRIEVLAGPHATQSVHGIAAFASLHTSIVFTAALVAHLSHQPRPVRWAMWIFFVLTALATVYFGWHYVLDVFGGLVVGGLSVWLGALMIRPRPRLLGPVAPAQHHA